MTDQTSAADDSDSDGQQTSEPTLSLFALATALPADQMPPFLQDQLKQGGPHVTVAQFQGLDETTQQEVAEAVEKAIAHYRQQAYDRRAGHTPARRSADAFEAFLEVAQK